MRSARNYYPFPSQLKLPYCRWVGQWEEVSNNIGERNDGRPIEFVSVAVASAEGISFPLPIF